MVFRSIVLSLFFCSFLYAQEKPVVVLELFTSQGCSSCPPADTVLEDIKQSMDATKVIPLSYHVDYWDYIGWKDPYASKEYTNKQRFYGQKFNSSSIYTPQLVINGKEHLVGSDKVKIYKKIEKGLQQEAKNAITLKNVSVKNNLVDFSYLVNGTIKQKNIHYILVLNERKTSVKRGENRNRALKNTNIVITEKIEAITSNSNNYQLQIPKTVTTDDKLKLIVLVSDSYLNIETGTQYNL